MLKKALLGLFISFLLISPALGQEPQSELIQTPEADPTVNLYFFWGQSCPHCANEKIFLNELAKSYPQIIINDYEVWGSSENRKLFQEIGQLMDVSISGVPVTFIADQHWIGWQNSYASEIIKAVESFDSQTPDPITDYLAGQAQPQAEPKNEPQEKRVAKTIELPIVGEINSADFSLPILTIIIAGLDGFNPCAMWTLIFLIGLLVNMKNRGRMWILGTAFIVTSAAFYFGVLAAWLNLLLFIGFIVWVRWLIGAVALGGGIYYIREFFTNKEGVCKITDNQRRLKTMERLKNITQSKKFWWALVGIILLAVAVNMIELICSAGLPAVYTQVLVLSEIAAWKYYAYLLLYVIVFMLDDLFVFFVAMTTLQVTGLTHKYSRISHIVGGIVMVMLGLLLWFRPEWLMFG